MSADSTSSTGAEQVTLTEADVAADLGALDPTAVPSVTRADGQPGLTEQMAGATLVTGEEQRAELEHPTKQFRLRPGDQPLPTGDEDAPNIHELVVADVMNRMQLGKNRYGQPLKPHNGRDPLLDHYEELLDACAYARQMLFERDGA